MASLEELIKALQQPGANVDVSAIGDRAAQGMQLAQSIKAQQIRRQQAEQDLMNEIAKAKKGMLQQQKVQAFQQEPTLQTGIRAFPEEGFKSMIDLQKEQLKNANDIRKEQLKQKQQFLKPQLTKGQESADREFGKAYNDYVALGGASGVSANMQKLDTALGRLEKLSQSSQASQLGTRLGGVLPEGIRGLATPKLKAIEQDVRTNVLGLLRQTLGPQFTEKEGERIFNQVYDPTLPPAENLRRVRNLQQSLVGSAQAKEQAIKHFEAYGTLTGLEGNLPSFDAPEQVSPQMSLEDFVEEE